MILKEIIERKRLQLEIDKGKLPIESMKYMIKHLPLYLMRDFKGALTGASDIAIIGEIKRASPSKGVIRKEFEPVLLAQYYEKAGLQAISVLTERHFFMGRDEYICQIREVTSLPILRKDFIIDPWQIYQSRVLGADAILLIAAILTFEELVKFQLIASLLGMDCLVEVHDRRELDMVLEAGADIIGINNRNLEDFSVSINTTRELITYIPPGKVVVSESGISGRTDVKTLQDLGVSALLIGETFMRSDNIEEKAAGLRGGGCCD